MSGQHKGRTCVVVNEKTQITNLAEIIFDDGNRNEFGLIKRGQLAALDMPGWVEKSNACATYRLEEYLQDQRGNGSNMLRTSILSQPRALKKGDVLATGEVVLENPRRGFNSSALIHLDNSGWIELASRIPIALMGNKKFRLPIELVKNYKLATNCKVVKRPVSAELNWVNIFLDSLDCCIETPSCVPLALA
jgi:hypothetical protein